MRIVIAAPPKAGNSWLKCLLAAVYDLGWTIPATFGPAAAGLIIDRYNPDWLWYIGGALCALAGIGFYVMHRRLGSQARFTPSSRE